MKKRVLWIDILNIFACFGVLIMHVSNGQVHNWDGEQNAVFWWGLLTHTFSYWPVPVFLMLSGVNILTNLPDSVQWDAFFKRRAKRTVIPFFIWSVIYSMPFILQNKVSGGGGF